MPGGLPVASIRTPSDSCSSSIPTLCITPLQGTTSSSKPAVIPVAGWIERLRPSRGWRPRPLRRSSGGVGIAPAATTTSGAEIRTSLPSARRASDAGRAAALAQHLLHVQPGDDPRPGLAGLGQGVEVDAALGVVGAADRALAGAAAARARCGAAARSASPAPRRPRARVRRCGPAPPSAPERRRSSLRRRRSAARAARDRRGRGRAPRARRSATAVGGRKQVPELITVVPPTARPSGSAIGGLPERHRRAAVAVDRRRSGRAGASRGCAPTVQRSPSSTITVSSPARASARAAKAPPAPEPTTIASQLDAVRPLRRRLRPPSAGPGARARGASRPRRSPPA